MLLKLTINMIAQISVRPPSYFRWRAHDTELSYQSFYQSASKI